MSKMAPSSELRWGVSPGRDDLQPVSFVPGTCGSRLAGKDSGPAVDVNPHKFPPMEL